ncbi:MAG: hypothetical protein H7A27_03765 [Spirochaetaceae bacterium]|nr:hypothetical protein [Spirochaetaceae bacterium]
MPMTVFIDSILESNLGYAALFICVGVGFLFLKRVGSGEPGPGHWALGFFLNAIGFLFWSATIPLPAVLYLLVGEVFHVAGFMMMITGLYRFTGHAYRPAFFAGVVAWLLAWAISIVMLRNYIYPAGVALKLLRAALFVIAGLIALDRRGDGARVGSRVAGYSLIAWGVYVLFFAFVRFDTLLNLFYGFLTGLQILSAFGMVAMVVDRMQAKAEASELRAEKLEGLLPICSYCKKIRDKNDEWLPLELYIEDRSEAEFSHGICPECFEKHRPDK